MTFQEILRKFRTESFTEKEKGTKFEELMRLWLMTDPRYKDLFTQVWLWNDFPGKKDLGGQDTGIDLVAKTDMGDYWAVQCKCYQAHAYISKGDVDSFLSTSSRTFIEDETFQTKGFSQRLWISTTDNWSSNALESLKNQTIPISRIGLMDIEASPVLWDKMMDGLYGLDATVEKKHAMRHQLEAISKAYEHFQNHDRGKLIMACGTGKTFTALKIAETLQHHGKGLILFMVPSISLLGQSLNAWCEDAEKPIKAICVCSDIKASKKNKDWDDTSSSSVDLAYPASTNAQTIARQLKKFRNYDGLTVVFSTYQSVQAVSDAQKEILKETNNEYGVFDFIVCDEAHRTTGVKQASAVDESEFTKIHNNSIVQGLKRMYMTATPRLYKENAIVKAQLNDCILCSMDDEKIYGKEFYRVNFSYAVQHGLLTDYKVLVLTVSENDMPKDIEADVEDASKTEINADETTKMIGVINGLSKVIRGDNGTTWEADPRIMHRAVAFCQRIGSDDLPGSSKNMANVLPQLSEKYNAAIPEDRRDHLVHIKTQHIDGSMDAMQRDQKLFWLKDDTDDPNECRVLTNVRCLSEGIDVPALDAVLFMSPRNSQVDVVQSVGRVMRNFAKGSDDEKKYGYIIIPVVVPADVKPEDALNDNERFKVVWEILNALRSHDDHFNAEVNTIALNNNKSAKVIVGGVPPFGDEPGAENEQEGDEATAISDAEVAHQLEIRFGALQEGIYAKLVEKVGDRLYWENWAKEIGLIAQKFIERIARAIHEKPDHKAEFDAYLKGLQEDLNPGVDEGQAIEMLAQHIITRPVFDALFSDYEFVKNNSVSQSMQRMINLLKDDAFEKDTDVLDKFYESVRVNVGKIDNLEGKQTVIKNLYEKFFKGAFPKTVEKLGIVYTPVECVDFIIHSVDDVLKKEFGCCISDENVHVLDPFVGTGTFVTRLLQSGLIRPEDLERKYRDEIHCCEIVLLAYYIADVNIESVFHELTKRKEYLPYDGICLTDTFQMAENKDAVLDKTWFGQNTENVQKLMKTPIRVIIGNPPYSVGQKSANDNAQNQSYKIVDNRIAETYVANTGATNKNALYDSYIKAFRWASDKLAENENGGIVGFISNGAWLDGNAQDGFRKCLEKEFSEIYVLNLRGNQRTSGELSRKEGGKIFGSGSRTPIAITLLVKKPGQTANATIHYHDIGDYLDREKKLKMVSEFKSISTRKFEWQTLTPNEHGDWISMRNEGFEALILLGDKDNKSNHNIVFNNIYARGIGTSRDNWAYNYSKVTMLNSMKKSNDFYNEQRIKYHELLKNDPNLKVEHFIDTDTTKISWSRAYRNDISKNKIHEFSESYSNMGLYRPYSKMNVYFDRNVLNDVGPIFNMFPTPTTKNVLICVSGISASKPFACLITDCIPDLQVMFNGQCFPLYWYEENKNQQKTLFDDENSSEYIRHDGISDWILKQVRERYHSKNITKEMIFYFVYGLLHSEDYRTTFAVDLKKSLPRIPIPDSVSDFMAFYNAGKKLAELHLNYEDVPACPDVIVDDSTEASALVQESQMVAEDYVKYITMKDFEHYRVNKLRFPAKGQKDVIIYNPFITIKNIPAKAYDYIVNGKSAIEWIMERYCVSIDKASGIKNDANDWAKEHNEPRYILDLLLSVINVSVQTVDIVKSLPKLHFDGGDGNPTPSPSDPQDETDKIILSEPEKSEPEIEDKTSDEMKKEENNPASTTLEMTTDKETFDDLLNGKVKSYELAIDDENYAQLLRTNQESGKLEYDPSLVDEKDFRLGDPLFYNKDRFPYYPINYGYVKFFDSVSKRASTVTLKVESLKVEVDKDKEGNAIRYEFDKKGKEKECVNGTFAQWIITYQLGEIVGKEIKEQKPIVIKDSVEPDGTIHGLSVRQPWATLLCTIKDVENRSWDTNLRGKLLIHASRYESGNPWDLLTPEQTKAVKEAIKKGILPGLENLPTGCYVGYATLTDCIEGDTSTWANPGSIHWHFKDPHLFKHPIEGIKGKLGFLKYKGELPE
jgi:predicted helicase